MNQEYNSDMESRVLEKNDAREMMRDPMVLQALQLADRLREVKGEALESDEYFAISEATGVSEEYIRFLEQNHLTLLHGVRVGTGAEISLGQFARNAQRLLRFAYFVVGILENLERLIVVRLCLSNDLKHLDRLDDLTMLLFC